MNETPKAKFALENYSFTDFSFKKPIENDIPINLGFNPFGKYYTNTGRFELKLSIACTLEGDTTEYIKVSMIADFKLFDPIPSFNDIPDYFYKNSIAIIYPYVRAFISTLSLQSNAGLIILPTLNLSNLESILKQNTKESIDEIEL